MGQTRTIGKGVVVVAALLSPLFFPFWMTMVLALGGAAVTPWLPLAVGCIVDALYFTQGAATLPWWSVAGLVATVAAFFVHRFVETSIMRA